ncbi:hypothetical protein Tco_1327312 [Tanacetum coccineum]
MACLAMITSKSSSLFKSKRTHDLINNVINAILEMRICFHDVSIKTSQENAIWKICGWIGSSTFDSFDKEKVKNESWNNRFVDLKETIEANVSKEDAPDVVGFNSRLDHNMTFVNVAAFNSFVEFGNGRGDGREFDTLGIRFG